MSDHLIGFLRFFYVCIIEPAVTQEANFAYICNCKVIFQRCEDKKMNPIIIICTIAIVVNGKEGKAGILVETADFVCNISSRRQLVVPCIAIHGFIRKPCMVHTYILQGFMLAREIPQL